MTFTVDIYERRAELGASKPYDVTSLLYQKSTANVHDLDNTGIDVMQAAEDGLDHDFT